MAASHMMLRFLELDPSSEKEGLVFIVIAIIVITIIIKYDKHGPALTKRLSLSKAALAASTAFCQLLRRRKHLRCQGSVGARVVKIPHFSRMRSTQASTKLWHSGAVDSSKRGFETGGGLV